MNQGPKGFIGPYWWKIAVAGAVTALVSDYLVRRMGAR